MRYIATLGALMFLLAGCGYDSSGPAGTAYTISLTVASTAPLTATGETRLVTAVVRDAYGSAIADPSVLWRSSAPSVATVAGSGTTATITAVDDGTANITATSGGVHGSITVTVRRQAVSIALSAPDSVIVAGFTTQLTVTGSDSRGLPITSLTGVKFASSNPFSVMVSASGLVTALFSSFRPFNSLITATVVSEGVMLTAAKRIEVASAAPPAFDLSALMEPEGVRPDPVNSAAEGIVFLTRDGAQVHYKILWSLLEGPPTSAHIHGPDGIDAVADVLVDLKLENPAGTNGTLDGSFSALDIHPQGGQPPISIDSLVTLIGTRGLAYVDIHTAFFRDGEVRGPVLRRQ